MKYSQDELRQARRILEVTHGDLIRTAYVTQDSDENYIAQAEGVRRALDVIEQVETGEWNSELAEHALNNIDTPADPEVDADSLQDLSQHVRDDQPASDHPIIERTTVDTEPCGYWALLKDFLGVNNRT